MHRAKRLDGARQLMRTPFHHLVPKNELILSDLSGSEGYHLNLVSTYHPC